jgi:tRNA-dihydrouridine synthase
LATGIDPGKPPASARTEAAIEHYESLLSAYGVAVGVRHARKHLIAFFDDAIEDRSCVDPALRETLSTSHSPSQVISALSHVFGRAAPLRTRPLVMDSAA